MADASEVVLLRVQLDEGKTNDRLKQLVLDIEKTRAAQRELNAARKVGSVDDAAFARQTVALNDQLKKQRQEQTALSKNLELYSTATKGVADSYQAQQAQLSLAQRQYQQLAGSANNSTEETQALAKVIDELRGTLKTTDAGMGLFVRNVGNYGGAIEPLIAEMKRLELQQKNLTQDSPAYEQQRMKIVGFQQAINKAGAEAGLTYEQTQAKLTSYGDSIAPVIQNLVQLEQEQQKVGEGSEQYARIGFQIQKLKKEIAEPLPEVKVPTGSFEELTAELVKIRAQQQGLAEDSEAYTELERKATAYGVAVQAAGAKAGLSYEEAQKKVAEYSAAIEQATAELVKLEQEQSQVSESSEEYSKLGFQIQKLKTQIADTAKEPVKLGTAVKQVVGDVEVFGVSLNKVSEAKAKYTQAANLAKAATVAETGALGALRLALIATGLGALVVVLGSVVVFLTKTAEGTRLVEKVMNQLGAAVNVVTDRLGAVGKAVVQVLSGDFTAAAQTAKGALTGIGDEISREITLTGDLTKRQQQLDQQRRVNADTNKRLLRDEENLKNIRDNEFNSLQVRQKANEDAFKVEQAREGILVKQAKEQLAIYKEQIALRGGAAKAGAELLDKEAEARAELADLEEDAAGRRNEYITNRFQLTKEGLDKEKEAEKTAADARQKAADKALAARQNELKVQLGFLDLELAKVQANSEEELNILRRKLDTQHKLDLAQKDMTTRQKSLIDAKYEADKLKLETDTERKRAQEGLQAERDFVAGALSVAEVGTQQKYELSRRALELDTELQLAALDVREDNAAKEYAIRTKLAADLKQLATDNAAEEVERQRVALDERAQLLTLATDRQLLGLSQEEARRVQLSEGFLNARKAGILAERDAQILGTKEGSAERLRIEQETAARLLELDRQTTEGRKQLLGEQFEAIAALTANSVNSLNTIQEAAKSQALNRDSEQMRRQLAAAGDNAEQREKIQKAHAQNQERIEKEYAEKRRKIAIAQALIDLASGVMQILRAPAAPFVEPFATVVRGVQIGLLTATAGAQIAAISSQRFAEGGVLNGPSHSQGGIPLVHRLTGRPMGEAEGDEIILTKGVWRSPLLRPLASVLNVMGGGKPLAPSGHMALGGVVQSSFVRESVKGPAPALSAEEVGAGVVAAIRRSGAIKATIVDVKEGLARDEFTQSMSNT
ncbi:hypothetical protein [Hymenobacter wooponensis]|uniref:Uncharacterized protein n=1 Tax=Hymenobacter wooponensis TaxID=1525360 RepID=A0A4Z0MTU9_9BACT|nr:hypothetical protein [Hymenobacter wooponensis]TGD82870.1 hypothetical protein EU557_03560 [Hymenobacter wooponensis]